MIPPLQHAGGLKCAAFSADDRWVITASEDNTTRLWDTSSGEQLLPLLGSNGTANWAAFSLSGRWVVTASNDHLARVWNVASAERPFLTVDSRPSHPTEFERGRPSKSVRWFSSDGRLMIEAQGGRANISATATGEFIGRTLEHASQVLHASFSPDNGRVATASDDNTVRIWDTLTGELLVPLMHENSARFVSFSSTGRLILTATNRTVRISEAATGEPITPPLKLKEQITRVSFAKDDTEVILSGTDQRTWTWSLHSDNRPMADLVSLACVLAGKQIDMSQGLLPLGPESLNQTWEILRREYPADLGPSAPSPVPPS
jgi:WD40 repeat protein